MSNDNVFLVVPAYNEARRLGPVVEELRRHYRNVVVVDDGSTDQTYQVASQQGCSVLRHVINRGQGAALQTGITYSLYKGAEHIVTFDADGQHQASDIPHMLAPVVSGEVDLTLGSRFLSETSNVPWFRRVVLRTATLFTRLTTGLRLTDCHNGFRAMSRYAAEQIDIRQDRMAHASEFYDQIKAARLSWREVPVSIRYEAGTLAKGQTALNAPSILFQYFFGKYTK